MGLDPLIDSLPVGAVVADGRLDEAERDLEIACRLGGVAIVVAYGRDDFPDVFACSHDPGPSSCWPVGEPDERMLIHPQALFHVPLRQCARGQVRALCVPAKTRDRGIIQANTQRMTHVVHCSTAHYIVVVQQFACWCAWLLQPRFLPGGVSDKPSDNGFRQLST